MAVQKNEGERKAGGVTGKGFQKGQSGNPGGRPKGVKEVAELAQQHTDMAIQRLAEWAISDNAKASVAACNALLDRAYGKPTQPIEGAGVLGAQIIAAMEAARRRVRD